MMPSCHTYSWIWCPHQEPWRPPHSVLPAFQPSPPIIYPFIATPNTPRSWLPLALSTCQSSARTATSPYSHMGSLPFYSSLGLLSISSQRPSLLPHGRIWSDLVFKKTTLTAWWRNHYFHSRFLHCFHHVPPGTRLLAWTHVHCNSSASPQALCFVHKTKTNVAARQEVTTRAQSFLWFSHAKSLSWTTAFYKQWGLSNSGFEFYLWYWLWRPWVSYLTSLSLFYLLAQLLGVPVRP